MQAAIGRKQLDGFLTWFRGGAQSRTGTLELLGNLEGLTLPFEPEWARSNWQSYCVRLPDGVDQRTVMQNLLDQGIATRRGIMCSHREAPYLGDRQRQTCAIGARPGLFDLLPIYAQMTEDDLKHVTGALRAEVMRQFSQQAKARRNSIRNGHRTAASCNSCAYRSTHVATLKRRFASLAKTGRAAAQRSRRRYDRTHGVNESIFIVLGLKSCSASAFPANHLPGLPIRIGKI